MLTKNELSSTYQLLVVFASASAVGIWKHYLLGVGMHFLASLQLHGDVELVLSDGM